ncbi:TIGR03088 family PEP-CTERM/XrtA system glycosyltransferase [Massilia norwichensis]|uniref:TIGR03088 family PEP-CTERM/XrtA system glycosyltransferase n=1 Tax=Massilia norwichensis TaxID=1442366 RepID=A0ABT2A9V5_9BURK|nr:TIGR03088 family PEP-CTERM/XrtA system glycosyltransferase [Massilia norwichensis]MCS0590986.1 TIGR03088 family PEP-CTERM/XrtA system glycosyltransferase [Massilia norwichensis]
MNAQTSAPLVVHLTYVLDFGGLETLLVERINRMPAGAYRHAVVALTRYTDFARKITKPGVEVYALNKEAGLSLATHADLFKLLRRLKPAILHTYNLAAIEYAPVALLAGVPIRINGLHGRDAADPEGRNLKHNFLRRLMLPFYDHCYANSGDMLAWNREVIGVPESKSCLLANGIDAERFRPLAGDETGPDFGFGPDCRVIGTVGRVTEVKDHATLIDAFALLRARLPEQAANLRLAIVGEGSLLPALREKVRALGLEGLVWLPGARYDVPDILRGFDIYAISSIAEGTPGSVLEAMASGLPVVGTRVGGVPEVIADGVTGQLVPPRDADAMADALARYVRAPAMAQAHGAAGRARVMSHYSMPAMVAGYQALYDSLLERKTPFRKPIKSCVE